MDKSDKDWKEELTPEQYHVLREKGTEPPGSGEYYKNKEKGSYLCAACGQKLFDSSSKYDSDSGWPSFFEPLKENVVDEHKDTSHGMVRIEATCSNCGGHLGHIFPDGPNPTGTRYCINSLSLKFKKDE